MHNQIGYEPDDLEFRAAVVGAVETVIGPLLGSELSSLAAHRVAQLALAELHARPVLGQSLQDVLPAH